MVSKTTLQQTKPKLFGEMVDSKTGAGNTPDEPECQKGMKCSQQNKESTMTGVCQRDESTERASVAKAETVWVTKQIK